MNTETRKKYHIGNWSAYNKALINRGNLTIWFEDAPEKWIEINKEGKKGRPNTYSNEAILCSLMIRVVFHLPLRALEGFLRSMFETMQLDLPVPSYTRICRRAAQLGQELARLSKNNPTDIVFDSTGVKVYGEGEWKVRQHGKGKKRTWRKVHLGVCPDSHEIILSELTASNQTDGKVGEGMIEKLPKSVKKVLADGAYDQGALYAALHKAGIAGVIPPRNGSRLQNLEEKPWFKARNNAIDSIVGVGTREEGIKKWKKMSGYHRRSIVESAMSRFKRIFGGEFGSREMRRQKAELYSKSIVMNKMTELGMPKGEWIAA